LGIKKNGFGLGIPGRAVRKNDSVGKKNCKFRPSVDRGEEKQGL